MRTNSFTKKLALNKVTICVLDSEQQMGARGGVFTTLTGTTGAPVPTQACYTQYPRPLCATRDYACGTYPSLCATQCADQCPPYTQP